ncbi:MAG TPA: anthrone oxygenase family protein [Tepidisphaeraceae bacterium]|jgi:uncharacterized membrane protein|nr:anthrone oxygenase family protein [Tepidisphaeraceae bacterium]
MSDRVLMILTLLAAVGSGVVGGAFFAFSTFVMKALARLAPAQGIAAMQSINIVVINVWFMAAMFGTAALCTSLSVWAMLNWQRPIAPYLLAGGLLYVIGTAVLTIVFHVPRNDALAVVDPASAGAAEHWARYVRSWTLGNHVRTAAAVAAAVVFMMALVRRVS